MLLRARCLLLRARNRNHYPNFARNFAKLQIVNTTLFRKEIRETPASPKPASHGYGCMGADGYSRGGHPISSLERDTPLIIGCPQRRWGSADGGRRGDGEFARTPTVAFGAIAHRAQCVSQAGAPAVVVVVVDQIELALDRLRVFGGTCSQSACSDRKLRISEVTQIHPLATSTISGHPQLT